MLKCVQQFLTNKDNNYGDGIDSAKKSLMTFYENVTKKPKFMAIIVGYYEAIVKDENTNIFIVTITSLKP